MKKSDLIIVFFAVLLLQCKAPADMASHERLTSFVNPFIGTDGPGNTYPGATVPFGMVQLSPDIGISGWDRIAGYFYRDSIITGFSHMHLSGTGAGDLYDILVMPTNSRFSERIEANHNKSFSHFSHDHETASPGYYAVDLLDYGIKAEVTASERTGIHRYTFPKDDRSQIHIDLGYALNWDSPTETYIKVVNSTTLEGYRKSTGWAKDQRVYFVIQLSKPFSEYQLFKNDSLATSPVTGKNTKIILNYQISDAEQIVLKTGLSTASIDGAYKSLAEEAPHFDFDKLRASANAKWEKELRKIEIKISDTAKKHIFYTMLYQSMLAPTLLSDYNGDYNGANGKTMTAEGYDRYDTFSLWDTYRAAHPLYTILQPSRVPDMVNSMLAHYNETGLLPVWSMQGNETNMMIGYHAVPVIVDAYFKGIKNFDAELAFEACVASATDASRHIDQYMALGYVPAGETDEDWSVSKTLEYAYDDWCTAQFAKALGKTDDYNTFIERSKNWQHLYDSQSTFMRPKLADGTFIKDFVAKDYSRYFCESNAWQYFWSVQHDVEGLIKSVGGTERFEQKLDSMFTFKPLATDVLPIFSTGMIGQYAHGNEPSHHVAYLYDYIGKPWKTQKLVREIMETQYQNEPNGHCGNEDCGQMSSWYVFSALGFYPVNPAQGIYAIGSPLVNAATMHLDNGKTFTITAKDNGSDHIYIQSITLNGIPLNRNYLTHQELMAGGELVFQMGAQPITTSTNTMAPSSQVYH